MRRKLIDKYIKIPILILAALLFLSSCGIIAFNPPANDNEGESTEAPDTKEPYQVSEYEKHDVNFSQEKKKFMFDLTNADYGGGSFLIATPKPHLITPDENTSAILSKRLENRNIFVQNEYNITISSKNVNPQIIFDEIKIAVKSSSYYADLIMIPQSNLGKFAVSGNIANLNSLPGINLDGSYYNASSKEAGGSASKIYGIAGPASIDTSSVSAVFFNKTMLSSVTEENIYKLVDNGSWTWDKFLQYADAVSTMEGEHFSVGTQNTALFIEDLIFISSGLKYVSVADGGMPQIAFTAEQADPIVDLIKSVTGHEKKYTNNLAAIDAFASGNTLFLIDKLSTMETLANSKADWGVVPIPKKSAEQKSYSTLVSADDALVFCVVPTVSDTQKVSNILAILNIAAYGDTAEAYAEDAMSYYLRDNSSVKMVETILNSAVFDLSHAYATTNDSIPSATYASVRYPAQGHRSVSHYLNTYTRYFNNAMARLFED